MVVGLTPTAGDVGGQSCQTLPSKVATSPGGNRYGEPRSYPSFRYFMFRLVKRPIWPEWPRSARYLRLHSRALGQKKTSVDEWLDGALRRLRSD